MNPKIKLPAARKIFSLAIILSFCLHTGIPDLKARALEQPVSEGDHFTFEGAALYRRPGCVPQLEVMGTHYQMGRQYGVLLRSELDYSIKALDRMLAIMATSERVPLGIVKLYVRLKATAIAARLPKRFRDEIRGVSEGSGFSYGQILAVSMCYDIFRLRGCTGVIFRNPAGELWHGHTTDIGWGLDWPPTIMVQYHPTGYHSFTSISWAGFLGTQTAYNDQGLSYSENTLTAKKINSRGFSVNYLARILMEECASLNETEAAFAKYGTINGEALYLCDSKNDQVAIAETTPLKPVAWAFVPMKNNFLYGVNLYQTPDFITKVQENYQTQNGFNTGRQRIFSRKSLLGA